MHAKWEAILRAIASRDAKPPSLRRLALVSILCSPYIYPATLAQLIYSSIRPYFTFAIEPHSARCNALPRPLHALRALTTSHSPRASPRRTYSQTVLAFSYKSPARRRRLLSSSQFQVNGVPNGSYRVAKSQSRSYAHSTQPSEAKALYVTENASRSSASVASINIAKKRPEDFTAASFARHGVSRGLKVPVAVALVEPSSAPRPEVQDERLRQVEDEEYTTGLEAFQDVSRQMSRARRAVAGIAVHRQNKRAWQQLKLEYDRPDRPGFWNCMRHLTRLPPPVQGSLVSLDIIGSPERIRAARLRLYQKGFRVNTPQRYGPRAVMKVCCLPDALDSLNSEIAQLLSVRRYSDSIELSTDAGEELTNVQSEPQDASVPPTYEPAESLPETPQIPDWMYDQQDHHDLFTAEQIEFQKLVSQIIERHQRASTSGVYAYEEAAHELENIFLSAEKSSSGRSALSRPAFHHALVFLTRHRFLPKARALLSCMCERPEESFRPTATAFNIVLMSCAKEKNDLAFSHTLKAMLNQRVDPDWRTWMQLADLAPTPKEEAIVLKMMNELHLFRLTDAGHVVQRRLISKDLRAHLNNGHSVLEYVKRLENRTGPLWLGQVAVAQIIKILGEQGRIHDAIQVIEYLRETRNFQPDKRIVDLLLRYCALTADVASIPKILEHASSKWKRSPSERGMGYITQTAWTSRSPNMARVAIKYAWLLGKMPHSTIKRIKRELAIPTTSIEEQNYNGQFRARFALTITAPPRLGSRQSVGKPDSERLGLRQGVGEPPPLSMADLDNINSILTEAYGSRDQVRPKEWLNVALLRAIRQDKRWKEEWKAGRQISREQILASCVDVPVRSLR